MQRKVKINRYYQLYWSIKFKKWYKYIVLRMMFYQALFIVSPKSLISLNGSETGVANTGSLVWRGCCKSLITTHILRSGNWLTKEVLKLISQMPKNAPKSGCYAKPWCAACFSAKLNVQVTFSNHLLISKHYDSSSNRSNWRSSFSISPSVSSSAPHDFFQCQTFRTIAFVLGTNIIFVC